MEMKVQRELIRSHREKRAWSQEHLATAAGISLRTIQRVEATGNASYESAQAVAAAFGIPLSDLMVQERMLLPRVSRRRTWVSHMSVAAASALASVGIFFATAALGRDVMLDVDLSWNGDDHRRAQVLTAEDEDVEIRIDGVLKLVIVPTIQADGQVLLATRLYESRGDDFVLLSARQLATPDDQEAEIHINSDKGNPFRVRITPNVQSASIRHPLTDGRSRGAQSKPD